jgi:phospholipase/carboxylesterase
MTKHKISDYPEINPLAQTAKKLMVFLHGVGSDGNDLIGLVPFIQKDLSDFHFISPNGIEKYDMAPFGYQWFSLIDRTESVIMKQVQRNAPLVFKIIEDKQKQLGLSNSDTFIFGFSQGAMLGNYLALTADEGYAGMLSFSGRLLLPEVIKNKTTPFCLVHGKDDSVVDCRETEKLANYLAKEDINHQQLIIPNLDHSIDGRGLDFATKFIEKFI